MQILISLFSFPLTRICRQTTLRTLRAPAAGKRALGCFWEDSPWQRAFLSSGSFFFLYFPLNSIISLNLIYFLCFVWCYGSTVLWFYIYICSSTYAMHTNPFFQAQIKERQKLICLSQIPLYSTWSCPLWLMATSCRIIHKTCSTMQQTLTTLQESTTWMDTSLLLSTFHPLTPTWWTPLCKCKPLQPISKCQKHCKKTF